MTQATHEAERLLSEIKAVARPNTANLRRLRKAASKRLRDADASTVLAAAKTLIDDAILRWSQSNNRSHETKSKPQSPTRAPAASSRAGCPRSDLR